ncbi:MULTISPECIES: hypothetical protein [Catenuloplanes]|uniref:Uncharacterized protein n=1 Tax=Catenuloplanes niger TaxID=587534 RepID=A0AAE4CS32_9ACTN|nr:hypothetical protein [Catenuloplanes niger]MDR7322615.1 hypothetical protein [Catenuloplanes niger]
MSDARENQDFTGRWRQEIAAIADSLSQHLRQRVEVLGATEMAEAFSVSVRGPAASPTGFGLTWNGVLGMQPIDGRPHISVSMFFYSRGERIRLAEHDGSYIELELDGRLDGSGTWRDLGWLEDEYGEYESYDRWE